MKHKYLHNVILGFNINEEVNQRYRKVALHFLQLDENSYEEFSRTFKQLLEKTNGKNNNITFYHLSSSGKDWESFIKDNPYFSSIKKPLETQEEFLDAIVPKEMTSYDIASMILYDERTNNFTQLRLQKILYLCFQKHLKNTGKKLFVDCDFETWEYGPVNNNIYQKYKKFGSEVIPKTDYELRNSFTKILSHQDHKEIISSICTTIKQYQEVSTDKLVDYVHSKNSAWSKAKTEGLNIIPLEYIKESEY